MFWRWNCFLYAEDKGANIVIFGGGAGKAFKALKEDGYENFAMARNLRSLNAAMEGREEPPRKRKGDGNDDGDEEDGDEEDEEA